MKELRDKDFDQIFKHRITEELPVFEEASWAKMERKLQKRDRLIFYRNASIILLLLSFGIAIYTGQKNDLKGQNQASLGNTKKQKNAPPIVRVTVHREPTPAERLTASNNASNLKTGVKPDVAPTFISAKTSFERIAENVEKLNHKPINVKNIAKNEVFTISDGNLQEIKPQLIMGQVDFTGGADKKNTPFATKRMRRKIPLSLAIVAGPDFNSTTTLIGGKTNLAFGIGIGIELTKKWSVQTGLNYGHKNYNANAYNYTFNNPNTKNTIDEVRAACKVLEIPLRASFKFTDNSTNSISLNTGLSSYIMLKENYIYKYTTASGKSDRLVEATNKNQHLLSVIDLSATYNIKLKGKKLAFGIEPYVKIPLTGIGVGNVPLKSSGISLKLHYDFNKN